MTLWMRRESRQDGTNVPYEQSEQKTSVTDPQESLRSVGISCTTSKVVDYGLLVPHTVVEGRLQGSRSIVPGTTPR